MITFTPANFQTPYCFPIAIMDDQIVENREDFSLILSASDEYVNFKIVEHMVEIIDDDCKLIPYKYVCIVDDDFYRCDSWLQPVHLHSI